MCLAISVYSTYFFLCSLFYFLPACIYRRTSPLHRQAVVPTPSALTEDQGRGPTRGEEEAVLLWSLEMRPFLNQISSKCSRSNRALSREWVWMQCPVVASLFPRKSLTCSHDCHLQTASMWVKYNLDYTNSSGQPTSVYSYAVFHLLIGRFQFKKNFFWNACTHALHFIVCIECSFSCIVCYITVQHFGS